MKGGPGVPRRSCFAEGGRVRRTQHKLQSQVEAVGLRVLGGVEAFSLESLKGLRPSVHNQS